MAIVPNEHDAQLLRDIGTFVITTNVMYDVFGGYRASVEGDYVSGNPLIEDVQPPAWVSAARGKPFNASLARYASLYDTILADAMSNERQRAAAFAWTRIMVDNGMPAAIEFVANPANKTRFDASHKVGARLSAVCIANGLIARAMPYGDILGFAPPLITTREDMAEIAVIVRKSVAGVCDQLSSGASSSESRSNRARQAGALFPLVHGQQFTYPDFSLFRERRLTMPAWFPSPDARKILEEK
jgi:hypothetical protein